MPFDFDQMGKLMKLAQQIDVDQVIRLSNKIDLGELLSRAAELDDRELMELAALVRDRAAGEGGDSGPDPAAEATPDLPPGVEARAADVVPGGHLPFRAVAVLGAGTMGAQIAAHLANAGLRVLLLDLAASGTDRKSGVEKSFRQMQKLSPDPLFSSAAAERIELGTFEDDFGRVAEVDWVIEAVVERLDVKRALLARVEEVARPDAVLSTNTSGLRIAEIAAGRSEAFRRRFLGTHFFNPPRYLELLELVPSEDTAPGVVERVRWFGRTHLGKGIVVAKDTPYFVGNRVGIYAMASAMRMVTEGGYTIEEVDLLTGTLVGRPKSATFRTADIVGLDVLEDVARNLYDAVPHDESRAAFAVPAILSQLVEAGALGQKSGAGFYRKEDREIKSIDPSTGSYVTARPPELGDLDRFRGDLPERLRSLFGDGGRAGTFFRETMLDVLAYSARRIPEIAESPADIDRAMRWGFGWELGPFQIWDVLGFTRVREAIGTRGLALPAWVDELAASESPRFYQGAGRTRAVYVPAARAYRADPRPADELSLAAIRGEAGRVLWENEEATLLDIGEGVALFEFRSKANTLGASVMRGLDAVIERVENDPDLRGLVVGNEGKHFSVGANLGELAVALSLGQLGQVERFVADFQETIQRVRYARKPVVVAVHGRVLGGGCEMVMASPHPVAAAESYLGLVELGVGLIPAGTGTMRLAALASERAPNGHPSEVQPWLQRFFENVALARVAGSARQAQEMGYLTDAARVVMHAGRRLYVAREEVIRLSNEGSLPPAERRDILVLGRSTRAALEVMLQQVLEGAYISDYDAHLARQLAYVMTGGELSAPQRVSERYLLELEREAFLRLLGEQKTQERIEHLLKTNKPLRN